VKVLGYVICFLILEYLPQWRIFAVTLA
jgi:hypothetical protein